MGSRDQAQQLLRVSWEFQDVPWALGGREDEQEIQNRDWNNRTQSLLLPQEKKKSRKNQKGFFMVGEAAPELQFLLLILHLGVLWKNQDTPDVAKLELNSWN